MGLRPPRTARLLLAVLSASALSVPAVAVAAPAAPPPGPAGVLAAGAPVAAGDRKVGPLRPFDRTTAAGPGARTTASTRSAGGDLRIGDQRYWLSSDDGGTTADGEVVEASTDLVGYTLLGLGDHIEVWVADDLAFPEGDCRNDLSGGALVAVTPQQAQDLADEFDGTILPLESRAFSVAPERDGSAAPLPGILDEPGFPADYWAGDGGRTVALVDNVRDQNFYDPTDEDGRTFTAGFFSSYFNDLLDRNVMTIDAFDWLHRTGDTPPDDSGRAEYLACAEHLQREGLGEADPRGYESVFAHEYQHLLEHYADPDEGTLFDEALSMWATALVGYADPAVPVDDPAADSDLQTFTGFYRQQSYGGPEQSLTRWGDQGAPEILADYGSAYALLLYLHDHFGGEDFVRALHVEPANGLEGLQAVLDRFGHHRRAVDVLHDFSAAMAVDAVVDAGARVKHGDAAALTTASMVAKINWDTPQAYDSPGAPANGADFVRLRDLDGYRQRGLVDFTGARNYPVTPVEWTAADGALVSGSGDDLDRAVVRTFAIPAQDPTITLDLDLDTEAGYDYFYVQVFDEATGTWVTLPTAGADPGTGGLSGEVSGEQEFDASPFAGRTVDVALRYVTDGGVSEPGVTVRSVRVGGQPVADAGDLSTWRSLTQARPIPVAGWTVQLVGYDDGRVSVVDLPVLDTPWGWKTVAPVRLALGFTPDVAAVLVTADDPGETAPSNAPYQLFVDGVLQPGGGSGA